MEEGVDKSTIQEKDTTMVEVPQTPRSETEVNQEFSDANNNVNTSNSTSLPSQQDYANLLIGLRNSDSKDKSSINKDLNV